MTTDAEAGCCWLRNELVIGQHQMDARRRDAVHALDRARELAFERPRLGDVLHERGQAERADLVEQVVAGVGALRQALLGQQHAGTGRIAVVDADRLCRRR